MTSETEEIQKLIDELKLQLDTITQRLDALEEGHEMGLVAERIHTGVTIGVTI